MPDRTPPGRPPWPPRYARPPGRGGRGAGRTAKYYEPSDRRIDVTIPERRYDQLSAVLLRALRTRGHSEAGEDAARRAARETGIEIGRAERARLGIAPPGPEPASAATEHVLEERGYEPFRDERGCVRLRNCPFHELAEQDRDLVCSLNERLVEGIVRGLGNDRIEVALQPATEECCVVLEPPAR